jgi:hypothetical protein
MNELNDEINKPFDFTKHIFWQYKNAQKLKSLISKKEEWYNENYTQFWNKIFNELHIETAGKWGLAILGSMLGIERALQKSDGDYITLSDDAYRLLLRAQLLKLNNNTTILQLNRYLKTLVKGLGGGTSFFNDYYDMSFVPAIMDFQPNEELEVIFNQTDIFPRPAGVWIIAQYAKYEGWDTLDGFQLFTVISERILFWEPETA